MPNPIDNGPRIGGTNATSRGSQSGARSADNAAPEAVNAGTPVETTITSERLQQVRESIDSAPEIDMDRVAEIKKAIAEGRFPIDPKRIAEKFAELEGVINGG